MKYRRRALLAISLILAIVPACGRGGGPKSTPTPSLAVPVETVTSASPPPQLTATPTVEATPGAQQPTLTPTVPVPTLATVPAIGRALTGVAFALDLDQTGELIYPANEFVHGVTRVYVRFTYQGMADVAEVKSYWYRNEDRVAAGKMAWDGGDQGVYIIWMEDPNGIERGEWRWELIADGESLGGSGFVISGEPGYTNDTWGLSFDPPASWQTDLEQDNYAAFSSPDQRSALALRVITATVALTEVAAIELATFQLDYPESELVETQELTMGGEEAVLQQVRYTDQESGDQLLYIVSSLHAESAYSLWMLGPAEEEEVLRALTLTAVRSVRFMKNNDE